MAIRDLSVVQNGAGGGVQRTVSINLDGVGGQLLFSDLFYEGSPIQFEQMNVAGYHMDANGNFYSWRTVQPVVFTISVFPGSKSDRVLSNMLKALHGDLEKDAKVRVATIQYSGIDKMEFNDGVMAAGMPGVSASGDNRMGAKTYRFAFGSMG